MEHGFRAYNKSIGYLQQALELAKKLEEKTSEANILAEMGYMERKRKDYTQSLEYYSSAVEIFVQQGEIKYKK
jgi:tetratricopeptide (TPR) repeat protein